MGGPWSRASAILRRVVKMSFPKYEPSRLASLPTTLDPAEYDISSETRKAQAERLAIRSRLKREYQLQYNDPSRRGVIVSEGPVGGNRGARVRTVRSDCSAQTCRGTSSGLVTIAEQYFRHRSSSRPREQAGSLVL